jgi:DNA-binding PadR family transcriptional regulator
MALEHAILVSLEERSGSGYELARRFQKSIGFFWAASHQQIYRTLKRMVELGWVSCEEVPQEGRPDKKVYRTSADGRAEVRRWLAESVEPAHLRDELAVKIRGASLGDVDAVLAEVVRHREHHAEQLAVYRAIEQRDFPEPDTLSGRPLHQHLVLCAGIRAEQGLLEWCDEVIEAMRRDESRRAEGTDQR